MKCFALAFSAGLCLMTIPSLAQAQEAAPAAPPDAAPAASGAAPAAGSSAKDLRNSCREQAKGQGLKGQAMRQAMMDCVAKQNPGMAGAMKCRMEAKEKGLKAGSDEMRSFMKDCRKKGA